MPSVITLTTDFGLSDYYVSAVKGVILSINPKANIVDISHLVEPQNIFQAAFILHTVYCHFPSDTIHVVIIDPGVGSQRRVIAVKTPSAYFLAPDNGVLSYILAEQCISQCVETIPNTSKLRLTSTSGILQAVAVTNYAFWLRPLSTTFHGRDIFAPVAAHLSMGVPICEFGETIDSVNTFGLPKPQCDSDGNIIGCILHIDHFGNLITNIKDSDLLGGTITLEIGKVLVQGIHRCYDDTVGLATVLGSSGYLEVSFINGNAAAVLKAKVGDEIRIYNKE
ncbi:S-adenosyl-l-methionine hydroxide adenosyltransferase family protein [Chloroflexota bacterium]